MKWLNILTLLLVIVGGINWGLIGLADFNLVEAIFGEGPGLTRVIYILVGVSAVWQLIPFARSLVSGERRAQADVGRRHR
ncbi:MAG TPA: DUF378 domain-containing protein [Caulobacteraceae bacterium]|jgi:hypothetical protein